MRDIIKKVTDIITIMFPAITAALGVLGLAGAEVWTGKVQSILLVVLGALSTAASILYDNVEIKK